MNDTLKQRKPPLRYTPLSVKQKKGVKKIDFHKCNAP